MVTAGAKSAAEVARLFRVQRIEYFAANGAAGFRELTERTRDPELRLWTKGNRNELPKRQSESMSA